MPGPVDINEAFESSADPKLEASQIDQIADITRQLLQKRYPSPAQVLRGVHPKSHGCVRATFEVLPDIDSQLQVGLFSQPATYDAMIRYSNASAFVAHDLANGENGSRGMAIKVLDVEGEVLADDGGRACQDFLMIHTPSFVFANVGDYLKLNQILLQDNDRADRFFAPLIMAKRDPKNVPTDPQALAELGRLKRSFELLTQIKKTPVANPLEVSYFGAAPFLFGEDRCMRFSVVPPGEPKPQLVPDNISKDYLREALEATMAGNDDVVFDFKVQVRSAGEADLHIEDATQSWPDAPEVTVARVTIPAPQTGLSTPEHLAECEELSFSPWHSLADHQPLGSINRLRYAVYNASAVYRRSQNESECE